MERVRREYTASSMRPKSASLVPSDWRPPLPANQASELMSLMGDDPAQLDPLLPQLMPVRTRISPWHIASVCHCCLPACVPCSGLKMTMRPGLSTASSATQLAGGGAVPVRGRLRCMP